MRHTKLCLLTMLAVLLLSLSACKKSEENTPLAPVETAFYDEYGRTLILHGASLYTNDDPGGLTRYSNEGAKRLIEDWGLNSVRMFWNLVSITPDSAVFSPEYLEKFARVVETFTNHGVYVVLAVNGTVTNSQHLISGTWMAPSGNAPNRPELPGPLNPAVQESMRRFWDYKNYPCLQDEFIKASIFVAKRFENNPYVLGYDIVNEPWGEDLLGTVLTSEVETRLLPEFYERYITRMRAEIPDKYIFYEPQIKFNHWETSRFITNLPFIKDARPAGRKLSFAPHLYRIQIDNPEQQGNPFVNTLPNFLNKVANAYARVQKTQRAPFYIGEWGLLNPDFFQDYQGFLNGHMALFDSLQYSWSYFQYIPDPWFAGSSLADGNDVEEPRLVNLVSRAYPMATAGRLNNFHYEPNAKVFKMEFINDPSISQPTEIFIPKRHYPNGWNLKIEGTSQYDNTFDEVKNILKLNVKNAAAVKVVIEAK